MTRNQHIYQMIVAFDFAPLLHDYGFALNVVAQYALYLLNRLYVPDSPIARLLPLAAYVITQTASQDGKVGGPVQVTTVRPAYGCMELPTTEVDSILTENRRRSESLRESFFGARSAQRGKRNMTENIRVIKGPIVPEQTSKPWESNIFNPVYSVYLDTGIIVTNPGQFPPEETVQKESSPPEISFLDRKPYGY